MSKSNLINYLFSPPPCLTDLVCGIREAAFPYMIRRHPHPCSRPRRPIFFTKVTLRKLEIQS